MYRQIMTHQLRTFALFRNPFAPTPLASAVPWWRRRGVIIGGIVALVLIIVGAVLIPILSRKPPITYTTQPVTTGNLSLSVSETGPLQGAIYNLIFIGTGGRIAGINVKVGQRVTQGQVLAVLDKTSLQDAYNQQKRVVQNAQDALNSALTNLANQEGVGGANLGAARTTLSNDQGTLSRTQAQQAALVAQDQQTLTNDQTALADTQAASQASVDAAQTTLNNDETALRNTQAVSQAAINAAQATLNSDQTALNNAQNVANAQIATAKATETQAIAMCTPTPIPATPPVIPTPNPNCVAVAENTYNQQVAMANQSVAQAQAKVTADQRALSSAMATANANNNAAQAKVDADQSALTTAQATANANNNAAQAKVNADQRALTTAQAAQNLANQQAQGKVSSDQQTINTTGANTALSNSTSQAMVTADAGALQSAQVLLQADLHNLNFATLTAPHNGIVSVINGSVGSAPGIPATASSGTASAAAGTTFIQLIDPSTIQVVANVNETDTANIKPGDPVQFTVNAYGSQQFTGTVDSISPNGQNTSNVVTFPVYINIDSSSLKGATLLSGMTANVTITTIQHIGVLLIPVNAINFARLASSGSTTSGVPQLITPQAAAAALNQARQMMNTLLGQQGIVSQGPTPAFVLEYVNGHVVAKPVVLGLTDGTQYEVLDGLTTNDTIITGASTSSGGQRTTTTG